jgi:polyhydroxybutyrate depolymerase
MKTRHFAILLSFCFLMASACAIWAQTTVQTLNFGGVTRSYRLHLPPTYNGSTPVPLVFNLHGYTSNAMEQELYSNMNAVSDTANFIVCYPDGLNNSWNSGFSAPYYGGVDDVGYISALIDHLGYQYNIDLRRVYSCGMSNGGFMSFRLACDLESRIAAVASVTGTMTSLQANNCNLARPVPVLQIHGTADATVPYLGATGWLSVDSVCSFWRQQNGCISPTLVDSMPDLVNEGSTVVRYWNTECADSTEVLHFKVENGGHTWPGAFPVSTLGNTNQDIKASTEIWHFFLRHEHPAPLALSAEAGEDLKMDLFPNPGSTGWTLSGGDFEVKARVHDLHGRVLGEVTSLLPLSFEMQGATPGVYFIEVISDQGTQVLKWMKR